MRRKQFSETWPAKRFPAPPAPKCSASSTSSALEVFHFPVTLSLYISFSLLIVLSNRCFSDLHHRDQQVARLREEDDHAAAAAAKEQGSRSRSWDSFGFCCCRRPQSTEMKKKKVRVFNPFLFFLGIFLSSMYCNLAFANASAIYDQCFLLRGCNVRRWILHQMESVLCSSYLFDGKKKC